MSQNNSFMAFFIGLLSITLIVMLVSRAIGKGSFRRFWSAATLATAIMFVQVGMMHLVNPYAFIYMIEGLVPFEKELVLLSGILEIVFGFALLWKKTRRWAAFLLCFQLLAMFPANINVAVNNLSAPGGLPSDAWYTWSRLLFQPLYIWWVYKAAIVTKKQVQDYYAISPQYFNQH